jgi:BirA family biotin operon repressor/biotin-[acetyl-CoA-carboxylase] ligase
VLLRPELPAAQWPWLPLWGGLAVARALRERPDLDACPEVAERRAGGRPQALRRAGGGARAGSGGPRHRAERHHDTGGAPARQATSLRLAGARTTDRDTVLRAVLRSLRAVLADAAAARAAYRELCSTLGERVRVELPAGATVEGVAEAVDDDGRLVVDGNAYGAGDVVHLRPVIGSP